MRAGASPTSSKFRTSPLSSENAPARINAPTPAEQAQLLSSIKRKVSHVITDDEWADFVSVARSVSKARAR